MTFDLRVKVTATHRSLYFYPDAQMRSLEKNNAGLFFNTLIYPEDLTA